MGMGFRTKTVKAPRARCRARAACITDNGFRFAMGNRGRVMRAKSNMCVRPSTRRKYVYLRTKVLVSYFDPVQTSFLGWGRVRNTRKG